MKPKYIIAHDVGTSSAKAVLIDVAGKIHCSASGNYPISTPQLNWVEQNPEDYWTAIIKTTRSIMANSRVDPQDIAGVIFTTQAMGIIPIDDGGRVLRPNITWVDGRAESQARQIMARFGGAPVFKSIVGIELMGKDVIPKLLWLKQVEPEIYRRTQYFLDVNGYLKFKATGRKVAEWSGACSYGFNLRKKDWLRFIFKAAGIDPQKLPPLVCSTEQVGGLTREAAESLGLLEGTPVLGGCDDTQSASLGSGAVNDGEAHIYLGTSAWVGFSTRRELPFKHAAVCLQAGDPSMYIVVGVTEPAGSCIQWIADQFYRHEQQDPDIPNIFDLMDQQVQNIPPGSDFLICTPWMLGERCPVSTTTTRATLFNIGYTHTREHLMRSVYEGVAYNLRWILENYRKDFQVNPTVLKVIGGGALDRQWMQIIADVTQKRIEVTEEPSMAGALGVAMCAAVGLGFYRDFEAIQDWVQTKSLYLPGEENFPVYNQLFRVYQSLYHDLRNLYRKINTSRNQSRR